MGNCVFIRRLRKEIKQIDDGYFNVKTTSTAGGTATGGTFVQPGLFCVLIAQAKQYYDFAGWYDAKDVQLKNLISNQSRFIYYPSSDITLRAVFTGGPAVPVLDPLFPKDEVYHFDDPSQTKQVSLKTYISKQGTPNTYKYSWYVDNNIIDGADKSQYSFTANKTNFGIHEYYCIVDNEHTPDGEQIPKTRRANITFCCPPIVTTHPVQQKVAAGSKVTSVCKINSYRYPKQVTYQWYVDGKKIGSTTTQANQDTFEFTPETGKHTLYCKIYNDQGIAQSSTVSIVSNEKPVLSTPTGYTAQSGSAKTLSVSVTNENAFDNTYQWYKNGTAVSGATSSSYKISVPTGQTTYYCIVSNSAGSTQSKNAVCYGVQAPTISTQPTGSTIYTGWPILSTSPEDTQWLNSDIDTVIATTKKLSVKVTGGYPTAYSYQWYKNGAIINGATSSSYTIEQSKNASSDKYKCIIYSSKDNVTKSITSNQVTVNVKHKQWAMLMKKSGSLNFMLLPNVSVKAYVVGGGGGGGCGTRYSGAGGGGGGQVVNGIVSLAELKTYTVTIGSAGSGATSTVNNSSTAVATSGANGSASSIKGTSVSLTAAGGLGGTSTLGHSSSTYPGIAGTGGASYQAGGNGASLSANGKNGKSGINIEDYLTVASGGSGGASRDYAAGDVNGGAFDSDGGTKAGNGTYYGSGGGGGGGTGSSGRYNAGGNGKDGCIILVAQVS